MSIGFGYQTALPAAAGSAAPAASWIGKAPPPGRVRLDSIDLLRGVVMVLMLLDHTRDFFTAGGFNLRDVHDPAVFITRWVTHFCAPVFVFLAGLSAFLHGARGRTVPEVSRYLFTRGLWLVLLEVTVVRFAWTFSLYPDFVLLQVIWAIGVSMVVLAGLIRLPRSAVGAIGIGMIACHNLLDGIQAEQLGRLGWLWSVLHQPALLHPAPGVAVFALYPLIPWIGVMAAGYALGPVMLRGDRRRWLVGLSVGVSLGFVLLRAANVYGDPAPWVPQDGVVATVLSFVNAEKYPPSALYLAMTLGPALVALAAFESARGAVARFLVLFGRVP
ncbi:MAG TPA: heparan-alpha-glucosaminide N-acetyltransferase domain-containing protein, partial [Geminicoccaceae bacterium]|nr:heparan-alpha-glucosaminide N-acetyltransferase domain-containing protein [Geminicoccaceae bacterium]